MTSPPAAPGAGGRPARPKSKTGRPDGGTTGRRELARHARFAEISPEVGVLDERAMSQALADDPAAFELLAAMTTATDENLRAAAIRLSASIVLERARAGRPSMRGISRLRPVRGATDGDLDIDASIEGLYLRFIRPATVNGGDTGTETGAGRSEITGYLDRQFSSRGDDECLRTCAGRTRQIKPVE